MTATELRQQAEIDRLQACLRSVLSQCDQILAVRWSEAWEVTGRVVNIARTVEEVYAEVTETE